MRSLVFVSVLLAASSAAPARASADQKDQKDQKVRCANAYEQAQRSRNDGQLLASRAQLLICTEEVCPAVLRAECVQWLGEVERATPTVLVVADAGGVEIVDVAVSLDGKPLLERLDGKAIPVDPGPHTLRFVRAGSAPIEAKVLVREGEKRRPVSVSFPPAPRADVRGDAPPVARSVAPTATWVLGGLGVIALGAAVPLYVSAYTQKSRLDEDPCAAAGTCDPDRAAAVKRRFVFGDVCAGVGVVALGAATIVWLTAPATTKGASVAVTPLVGGVAGSLRVVF